MDSFKTKNHKLARLIQAKTPLSNYRVPIINLSDYELSEVERKRLQLGLEYSFVNKNRDLKKKLAANLETLASQASSFVDHTKLEDFHEFLRAYADIFTKNIYATKDYTYKNLKNLIENKDLVVISGDKDSCVVILKRGDYDKKLQGMIDEGNTNGTYAPTADTILNDLKKFQDFLRRNFKGKFDRYKDMRPVSNQPGRLYATAKTHKFSSLDEITIEKLKFRPIISQVGTYTYNAAKVIADYLKPLCQNEYKINDTQSFPSMLKDQEPLNPNEEYVSYDVESLFTNIPVDETINYIINEIYQKKKLPQICSKTIFKRLLYKLTTEVSFQFNYKLFKQTDGYIKGGPLSVTLSDIHMIRMETDAVVPIRPIFYKRYVDDIYNRRQKNTCDVLCNAINNYHPKIKLTIETNPQRFLDTEITHINGTIETRVHRKKTKLPIPWTSNIPKRYKRNSIKTELYRAKRISSNFTSEVTVIRNKFESAGYPKRFVNSIIREFNAVKENDESDFIIPPWLFEGKKKVVLVEIPFCLKNEISSKHFIKKFNKFTNNTFDVRIKWLTQKVKNLFRVKDKS